MGEKNEDNFGHFGKTGERSSSNAPRAAEEKTIKDEIIKNNFSIKKKKKSYYFV